MQISFQGDVGRNKVSPEHPLLQTKSPQNFSNTAHRRSCGDFGDFGEKIPTKITLRIRTGFKIIVSLLCSVQFLFTEESFGDIHLNKKKNKDLKNW